MIKKILIGFVFVLVFVIILCFNLIVKDKFDVENSIQETALIKEPSIENDTVEGSENIEHFEAQNMEQFVEEKASENPVIVATTKENNQPKTNSNVRNKNVETKSSSNDTSNKSQSEIKTQDTKEIQNIQIQPNETEEIKDVTEDKNETTLPVVPVIPKPEVTEEKYVRNDTMINRIRQTINNNPSEYMLELGYEIIVDSSIKEHTNQFTFTENRVKGYIAYKFGTIRIYAEDYIRDGQLIMTECYIY